MVAISRRAAPFSALIDRYRKAVVLDTLQSAQGWLHSLGTSPTFDEAEDEFFPAMRKASLRLQGTRMATMTRAHFDAQLGPTGALLVAIGNRRGKNPARKRVVAAFPYHVPNERRSIADAKLLRRDRAARTDVARWCAIPRSSQPQRVLPTVDRLAAANRAHSQP